MLISITKDFTSNPGIRYKTDCKYSGEEFREYILLPAFKIVLSKNEKLTVDLDGCYGFAASFLEESFGGLVRKTKMKNILDHIEIISNDDLMLNDLIRDYVEKAESRLERIFC